MGLRISKSHRHIRGPDVFFCIRKHYETDKVEMFGVAPPAAYTAPNLYITRAITCRYKSHRQIKFWRDSLAGINSRIQPGETAVTRTCVRPLVLSFSPSFTLSLFRFISLSPSLSLRHPPLSFFSLALVMRGYLSFYTPDGQVLLPLHARTPSAIISSARRCGLFSSLIRTNAGSRFHQTRLFLFLSFFLALAISLYISDN